MALKITVDKPEFNLRETLTRLDTERIPYEKMPVGSVIQVQQHHLYGSGQVNTTSSSFQDSGLFIDFHPKFANSRLLVTCEFNAQSGDAANSGLRWSVLREIDGTPTASRMITNITIPAPGTAAVPMLASTVVRTIVNCAPISSDMFNV